MLMAVLMAVRTFCVSGHSISAVQPDDWSLPVSVTLRISERYQRTTLYLLLSSFCMFLLFNFLSIFPGGSADPICPYVRAPMGRRGRRHYVFRMSARLCVRICICACPGRGIFQLACYWLSANVYLQKVLSVLWHWRLGAGKSMQPANIEWWGVGVVICLERGADCFNMVQLMPLPSWNPIVSWLI